MRRRLKGSGSFLEVFKGRGRLFWGCLRGRAAFQVRLLDWVAVKEHDIGYYDEETLLFTIIYPSYGNLIFSIVTYHKFLKTNPV